MPVQLSELRELLLPGMRSVAARYTALPSWQVGYETTVAAPHIWIPKLTIPEALAVGAAAAIIKNPIVTRRFWKGWFAS